MHTHPRLEEIQRATAEAARRHHAKHAALAADAGRGPAPGDLYLFPHPSANDLRWAVVSRHPDQPLFFAVPADGHPLAGLCDVAASAEAGPLVLRCGHGLWIHDEELRPEWRVGTLDARHVRRAADKVREILAGSLAGSAAQKEAEADPEYADWLAEVERSSDTLAHLFRAPEQAVSLTAPLRLARQDAPHAAEASLALAAASENALGLPDPDATSPPGVVVELLHPGVLRLLAVDGETRAVWEHVEGHAPPDLRVVEDGRETPAAWKRLPGGTWWAASFPASAGPLRLRFGEGERARDLVVNP